MSDFFDAPLNFCVGQFFFGDINKHQGDGMLGWGFGQQDGADFVLMQSPGFAQAAAQAVTQHGGFEIAFGNTEADAQRGMPWEQGSAHPHNANGVGQNGLSTRCEEHTDGPTTFQAFGLAEGEG